MKKKLAIISSYNDNCGNASYTHALKMEFSNHYDVDVIPLDLFLLQNNGKRFKKAGDSHINKICESLSNYDFVNIQFEFGLYGANKKDVLNRIKKLIDASKNLVFTYHRVDVSKQDWMRTLRYAYKGKFKLALADIRRQDIHTIYEDIAQYLKKASDHKNVWSFVHTKRDRRTVTEIFGFKNCIDFPLCFLTKEQREYYLSKDEKAAFLKRYNLCETDKIIGAFGYIAKYKGFETLVSAISHLDDSYKLVIFGTQHPQSIIEDVEIDEYINDLIKQILMSDDNISNQMTNKFFSDKKMLFQVARDYMKNNGQSLVNTKDRVIFAGNLGDEDFISALRYCNFVVLPYLEVGQSMSGVVSLALETKANLITTNNNSFSEVKKYFDKSFATFDIGNFLELTHRMSHYNEDHYKSNLDVTYEKYNIHKLINAHIELFEHPYK